ncbi:MAG: hypothetical protein JWN03_1156 [Nocardia sp.]|uniref:hypothetical protein n=1 Tax=Nocardia sp. TaxID=1821 RepID=UPI00260815E3|nr:hypothetical protein [Nocardia sp.]MCU1640881.1 hypothetical protein [Nocardia sp.]
MITVLAVAALWSLVSVAVLPALLLAFFRPAPEASRNLRSMSAVSTSLLALVVLTLGALWVVWP